MYLRSTLKGGNGVPLRRDGTRAISAEAPEVAPDHTEESIRLCYNLYDLRATAERGLDLIRKSFQLY